MMDIFGNFFKDSFLLSTGRALAVTSKIGKNLDMLIYCGANMLPV